MNPIVTQPDVDPEKAKEVFEKAAEKIVKWNLTTPAILFLESFRPMNLVGAHVFLFFQPLLQVIFSLPDSEIFAHLMMHRENMDRFITTIEEKDREFREKNKKSKE
ncbi:MAG: hypothetical protein D6785_12265 [Planctomycetota bacterium]|nr:MAG: hypothetical protein D6785_12265 [Planctomycetota bacterium]